MKLNRKEFLSGAVAFAVAHSLADNGRLFNTPKMLAEVRDSKTAFARDALQQYVDSGELPGAISVFYKDGVQETCCIGYADVAAKRAITSEGLYGKNEVRSGFA